MYQNQIGLRFNDITNFTSLFSPYLPYVSFYDLYVTRLYVTDPKT